MTHLMKLNPKYFEFMKNGSKRVEIRLNDEKRRNVKVGDTIIFQKKPELIEKIETEVEELIFSNTFEELIKMLNIAEYADKSENVENFVKDIYKFYTKDEEEKYGVVGIRVKKI